MGDPSEIPSSSSSSVSNESQHKLDASIKPYHVFINHRGPDVKDTLASTIYHSLYGTGLYVFFDKTEFQPGQELLPTIKEAIRTALVHIVILSKRYVESNWCLEELCLIQKSGSKIIPVFYHVPPADLMLLRNGKGVYADSFAQLENKMDGKKRRFDSQQIEEWREALGKVCNISGLVDLDSNSYNGDEGKLVETIVNLVKEHVRKELKKSVKGLVGLDEAVEDFHYFLSEPSDDAVKIVGIVGPEGSGKTTLAEEFYYRYRKDFHRSSLLFGVREASRRNGLLALQRQLLNDLTNTIWEINNKSEGQDILAERIQCLSRQRSFKFLIVIDDVDHQDQLDALLLGENVLGKGSLVILASRDKAILKLSGISMHYEMKPLAKEHARELLCGHAFNQDKPIQGLESVVETAVTKFGGLPLFLKLIGRHLRLYGGNSIESWHGELTMFCELTDIVKATFNALGEEEQQIFLDIACFFLGMEKESAIRIWDGSGWRGARGLQKLEYNCLVEIDENNCLKMHDFFRDFGQQVAKEQLCNSPEYPCRLWLPNDAANFLHGIWSLPESAKIRGLTDGTKAFHGQKSSKELKTYTFSSLKIELLDIAGDVFNDTVTDQLLDSIWLCWKVSPYTSNAPSVSDRLGDLVWFRWRDCPHASLPPLEMNNLRVLELVNGNFKTLCDPTFKQPSELRELNVIRCRQLVALSPSIGSLNHLEKMVVNGALHLQALPEEFCDLNSLKHLVLRQCEDLTSLPRHFGQLKNLEHIDLSDCQILSKLPQSFGKLTKLRYLNLRNCRNLNIHAQMFEEITSLEELNFENCKKLLKLPTQTICQGSLRKLNLLGTSLMDLPDDIEQLGNLQFFYIESPSLTSISSSLGKLPCLRELVLFNCTKLNSYPNFVGRLDRKYARERQSKEDERNHKTLYVYTSRVQISDSEVRDHIGLTSRPLSEVCSLLPQQ